MVCLGMRRACESCPGLTYEIPPKFALIKYVLECASDVGCCMKPAKTIGTI